MKYRIFARLAVIGLCLWTACWGSAMAEAEQAAAAIDLTGLVNALLALLGAVVSYRLLPWLKANTSRRQMDMACMAISTAVYAAEQLYKNGEIQDRLDYAMDWLRQQGYCIDRIQVEAEVARQRAAMSAAYSKETDRTENKEEETYGET